jgi:hypothetical protein
MTSRYERESCRRFPSGCAGIEIDEVERIAREAIDLAKGRRSRRRRGRSACWVRILVRRARRFA